MDPAGSISVALMRRENAPFLWLCGPFGVGKSSTAFALFDQLSEAGVAVAQVDLDQLGLCGPAPPDDPGNNRLKARNLGAVWAGFRAAGARCLVVSGVVDEAREVRRHADRLPDTVLTVCRLRVDEEELRRRIARRGSLLWLTEVAVRSAARLDRSGFADLVLDTTGLPVAEVVARIRATGWPGPLPPREPSAVAPPDDGLGRPDDAPGRPAGDPRGPAASSGAVPAGAVPALWLCGPPAVGKSTVGFEIFLRVTAAGVRAAYVDLAQIGFCRPTPADDPDHHRLRARQLGRIWEGFRAAGARCLVMSGNVTDQRTVDRYTGAIPSAAWTVCRLRAGRETLAERVMLRGRGGGPGLMGDDLRGRPEAELRERLAQIVRIADGLDHAGLGDISVDTDGRAATDLADLVCAKAGGWPATTGEPG